MWSITHSSCNTNSNQNDSVKIRITINRECKEINHDWKRTNVWQAWTVHRVAWNVDKGVSRQGSDC